MNDRIPNPLWSLHYALIDYAFLLIARLGHNTLLLKIDLKSAYWIVLVHLADQHLLGLSWNGYVYVDQVLPFGLRSIPQLFMAMADAVGWLLVQMGVPLHLHYLEDFLFFLFISTGNSASRSRSAAGPPLSPALELELHELDQHVCQYFNNGLAPPIQAAYRSAAKCYLAFCSLFGLSPLPLSPDNVTCFIAH